MKKYTYLLFDVDGTLMDFNRAEREAYIEALHDFNVFENEDNIVDVYSPINQKWWKKLERKETTKQETLLGRHRETFETLNMNLPVDEFNDAYANHLSKKHYVMEGAIELLDDLRKQGYTVIAATNGVYTTQQRRLTEAELINRFDGIYVSEKIGVDKPNLGFFEAIFNDYKEMNSSNTLMIGDSLTSDIKGGINAGLDTCWLNIKMVNDTDIKPTYEIHKLKELYTIIN